MNKQILIDFIRGHKTLVFILILSIVMSIISFGGGYKCGGDHGYKKGFRDGGKSIKYDNTPHDTDPYRLYP